MLQNSIGIVWREEVKKIKIKLFTEGPVRDLK